MHWFTFGVIAWETCGLNGTSAAEPPRPRPLLISGGQSADKTASSQPPATGSSAPTDNQTAERDRLWQSAEDLAAKKDWPGAIRAARAAYVVQSRHHGDQPLAACEMLESLSYWSTRQKDFSGALATARELTRRRTRLLGDAHWQTIDARLNTGLIEQLTKLTADEWEQFLRADELQGQASALLRVGQHAVALGKAVQALPIYTQLLGREQAVRLTCLAHVVQCRIELGQYLPAYAEVKELIELVLPAKGPVHPDTILAVTLLGRFNEATGNLRSAEEAYRKLVEIYTALRGPQHPDTWFAQVEVGKILSDRDQPTEAISLLEDVLDQQREALGKDHPSTTQTMKVLGMAHCKAGHFDVAEPLLTDAVNLCRQHAGDTHLATAGALNARGRMYLETGRLQLAAADLTASLKICRETLGDTHPTTGKVLDNFGRLHELSLNLGSARLLRQQCLTIAEQAFGDSSLPTSEAWENLAQTYILMNDFSLAEPYLLRARRVLTKLLGPRHPRTAAVVGQLAYVYLGVGEPQRSEPLYLEALQVLDETPDSTLALQYRKQLALLYQSIGRFSDAETEYRRVLRALEAQEKHPPLMIAEAQTGLAQAVLSRGRAAEACTIIDKALGAYGKLFHEDDPEWLDPLGVAGLAHLANGENQQARELLARNLRIAQLHMDKIGAVQSERQRLVLMKTMRLMLDYFLSVGSSEQEDLDVLYQHVLSWKGAIASRQWRDRQWESPEVAGLTRELQQISRKLATITLQPPAVADRDQWIQRIFELNVRKEDLEQQRATYGNRQSSRDTTHASAQDVVQTLPAGTALIDFLHYTHTSFVTENNVVRMQNSQRSVAFIIRPDRPLVRVDLGDTGPVEEAVHNWHLTRGFAPKAGTTDWSATISRLLWEPVRPHVADCQTLLISPDGNLSQLAWNALPGRNPNSYLIEDFEIATIAVPQLLPLLNSAPDAGGDPVSESLLLVGDVNYDGVSDVTDQPATDVAEAVARAHFTPLKGTVAEVHAVRDQFARQFPEGQVELLARDAATEANFWREAPKYRWLHIATHGFFAPPNILSSIATQKRMDPTPQTSPGVSIFHVGFLNGLALTGANRGAVDDGDDGILTAAELATMDLRNIDVAVLSGCETGLGEVQCGEGSFGMVRALHIAGVNTTIGSLWPVSDAKTNLLMQRFYANLWERKLPKLEALREAQLWLLNTGGKPSSASPTPAGKRLSPHYWAAFTLSGYWK